MYEFRKEDAYAFAQFVFAHTRERGRELEFKVCPYCKRSEKDNQYKFSINLENGAFKCLRSSCGVQGNMITLAKDFDFRLSNDFEEYTRPRKKYKDFKQPPKKIEPKPPAVKYLESRGIPEEIAKRYEITVQTGRDNILVFPFYDEKGKLTFIKYRKTDFKKGVDSGKEWTEAGGKPILFGMKQCNLDNRTLIITEGQLDSMTVAAAGFENAVSVPTGAKGFTWVPYCWDFVQGFDTIIVFGDYENGHMSLLDEITQRFKKIIKHVRYEDYKDCKDANDIIRKYSVEQVRNCINNAVEMPVDCVIRLADVPEVNPFDYDKLSTTIASINKLLYGGLPFGGVTLIAGKRGDGKSTLASQIIIEAVEKGHKCFCYSGELQNHLFKAWIHFQAAGPRHVITYQNKWGDDGFSVSSANAAEIQAWYADELYIYDSTAIDGDEKTDLLKKIEETINRYGVDVILIDNLMTALDLMEANTDRYEKQSLFVKALARLAMKYNVLIILVAHMRKNSYSNDGNDEVMGSSDITNLASVTLTYERDSNIGESQRLIRLVKNRLFGKTNFEGFVVNYEEKSKRIYGLGDDVFREYGWKKGGTNPFMSIDDDEETPFG